VLPEIFHENFKEGLLKGKGTINKGDFYKAIQLRYALRGWDSKTGVPLKEKLIELDLDWLINLY
jgi:aldehyde:ferredoxin oxidoreductase